MMSDITFSKNDESKKDAEFSRLANLMGYGGAKIDHGNVTNSKPSNKSLDPLFGVIFTAVGVDYIHSSVVEICIWASEVKVTRTRSPNVLLSVIKHSVSVETFAIPLCIH